MNKKSEEFRITFIRGEGGREREREQNVQMFVTLPRLSIYFSDEMKSWTGSTEGAGESILQFKIIRENDKHSISIKFD